MAGRRNGLMPLTEFEGHWKDIRGYEGIYQVSDLGEVRRLFKAGKANHISYQAVLDRCSRRVKNPTALDGHDYRWDDKDWEGKSG